MAGSCLPVLGTVLIAPVLPKIQEHFAAVPGAKTLVPVVLTIPAPDAALTLLMQSPGLEKLRASVRAVRNAAADITRACASDPPTSTAAGRAHT